MSDGQTRTGYLPAGRTEPLALAAEIARAASSPVLTGVLRTTASALTVLDANRQIVAFNAAWQDLAGEVRPEDVLGARPGEALGCAHSATGPDGCGTCTACASCGLAVAVLAASHGAQVSERFCFLRIEREGRRDERALRIRASPLELDDSRFVVVTLTDQTEERRHAEEERAFVHDLANLASGLTGVAAALSPGEPVEADVVEDVRALSGQLVREIRLHRALAAEQPGAYTPTLERARAADLLRLAQTTAARGDHATGRAVDLLPPPNGTCVVTDPLLVQHVLLNMLVNALEASRPGDKVRLEAAEDGGEVAFRVWSRPPIPEAVRPRIFQRHFTTRSGPGRGLGTYAMKLYGERLLGGRVGFTSSQDGTTFELRLRADGQRIEPGSGIGS